MICRLSEHRLRLLSRHQVFNLVAHDVCLATHSHRLEEAWDPALRVEAADLLNLITTIKRGEGLVANDEITDNITPA